MDMHVPRKGWTKVMCPRGLKDVVDGQRLALMDGITQLSAKTSHKCNQN